VQTQPQEYCISNDAASNRAAGLERVSSRRLAVTCVQRAALALMVCTCQNVYPYISCDSCYEEVQHN
jgi:hypothetical protein